MIFEYWDKKDYKMDRWWIVLCCKTLHGDMLHSLSSWCCFHLLFLYFQYHTISNGHIILFNLEWSSCSSLIIVQMILNSVGLYERPMLKKKKIIVYLFMYILEIFYLLMKEILSFIPSNMTRKDNKKRRNSARFLYYLIVKTL